MTLIVSIAPGHDIAYPLAGQAGQQAGQAPGGYYSNASQQGEAPGRWLGKGAEALGFTPGQTVQADPYLEVYSQRDPRTGAQLGRTPGQYQSRTQILARLMAAEPHATAERVRELERAAAQKARQAHPYVDFTIAFSKSVSVVHASIRENARLATLAGDTRAAKHWADLDERFQEGQQAASRAAVEYLDKWAHTRTGYHGTRVGENEPGRYEDADLVVTAWLQGTSRDGDPHDHVHHAILSKVRTRSDGKWRALDTMALRYQAAAAKGIAEAHFQSFLVRELGLSLISGTTCGPEIAGVTAGQMNAYSSRSRSIQEEVKAAADRWTEQHGRPPCRSELKLITEAAAARTRKGKDTAEVIDWHDLARVWDEKLGGALAQIAREVGLPGPDDPRSVAWELGVPWPPAGPRGTAQDDDGAGDPAHGAPRGPAQAAQVRAMKAALARVQDRMSTWQRADLIGELGNGMPDGTAAMLTPTEAALFVEELADRVLSGEVEQVMCLAAPEFPDLPAYLRRDLDGQSVYTRPGAARYATRVQLAREERLAAQAREYTSPVVPRSFAAQQLGATVAELEHWLRVPRTADEMRVMLPSGVSRAQAAAAFHMLTAQTRVVVTEAPAGSGKTTTTGKVADIARAYGRLIAGAAPSQTAANELRSAIDAPTWNTAQFLGHKPEERGASRPKPMPVGGVLFVDEASMVGLQDMVDLVARARVADTKVIVAGDTEQLAAVEGGGVLSLLTGELGRVQLPDPVRFAAQWERDASVRLRDGDADVLTVYADHGRIVGMPPEQALEEARRGYVADIAAGRDPLLMAYTRETCRELSMRIRDDLIHLGIVDATGPTVRLANGVTASAGDLIICRKNDHNVQAGERSRTLANGDTLRIDLVDTNGNAVVRRLVSCDRQNGERQYSRPFLYRKCRESDLAYAVTAHTSQGRTVSTSTALFTGIEDREWAYVALTRGALGNHAIVSTAPPKIADVRQGTRPAPELERFERIQQERAGHNPGLPPRDQVEVAAGNREAEGVLSDVLSRTRKELSATETRRQAMLDADHLAKLHAVWQGEVREAVEARWTRELRDALPAEHKDTELSGYSTWLFRTLRGAEAAGLNSCRILTQAVQERSLHDARDICAVLDARIRESTAKLVPLPPRPWSERIPDTGDPDRQEYVQALAEAMDARAEHLGEHAAEAPPPWAVPTLGPVPDDPLDRLEWQHRASAVASYREMFGYTGPDPIGPEPVNSPEARAAWHGAFAALGPVDGVDLRSLPDGSLLHMASTYEALTAWAPRYVAPELRMVREAQENARRAIVASDLQEDLAQERFLFEDARRHKANAQAAREMQALCDQHEPVLADAQAARLEWEQATEQERHLAVAADSEYRRRNPDTDRPPLRSAEPAPATEDERAELLRQEPPAQEAQDEPLTSWQQEAQELRHFTPAWVTETVARTQAAREKLAERSTVMVPDEDPDHADLGQAWPDARSGDRDAILQPAPARMRAAQREMDRDATAAVEMEAGG